MKKKLIIAVIVAFAVGLVGYFGFQWYLSTHRYEPNTEKPPSKEVKLKEETSKGVVLNSLTELNGVYVSETTNPTTSEIIFKIGGATATQGTFKKFEV